LALALPGASTKKPKKLDGDAATTNNTATTADKKTE